MKTDELIAEALSRPIEERVQIAEKLLQSMNPVERENEEQWIKKAQERLADLRSDRVKAVPGQEVFNRIWKRYA